MARYSFSWGASRPCRSQSAAEHRLTKLPVHDLEVPFPGCLALGEHTTLLAPAWHRGDDPLKHYCLYFDGRVTVGKRCENRWQTVRTLEWKLRSAGEAQARQTFLSTVNTHFDSRGSHSPLNVCRAT
jgi:hypothetical protein